MHGRDARNAAVTAAHLHRAGDLVFGGRNGGCQNPSVLPQTLCKELGPDGSDVCLQPTHKLRVVEQVSTTVTLVFARVQLQQLSCKAYYLQLHDHSPCRGPRIPQFLG